MHAVGPDVGTSALLFAAVRNLGLFESLVVGSGATSPELAAGGLKDLIEAPAGAFDSVEGGEVAVQFVTQSAAVATPDARFSRITGCPPPAAGLRKPRDMSGPTLGTFPA